ncbi:DUF5686 and carboxypeptidase regulatory-like domain-containing protein [Chitinophagaceae bacterium LB-8]|uniref:DUF5686 and carboxypeptidase regulatory-like domain-containing protein n=1 Tax=Paraflavisolibacter caeni TaxID=2982496 RepID=A0A9X2XX17_9BACT|nr:DUF5686 family protein [Paraflavisolibacter caeni]MCU7550291.1 DUF5686 and carboxypeptidase regulatory-like domain-containing protein [Paraflavisolibacter caeni]
MRLLFLSALFICFGFLSSSAQKVLKGIVMDRHSNESVPFASVQFKKSGAGKLADSSGTFMFLFQHWPKDTLLITSVGYQDYEVFINPVAGASDTISLLIKMEPGKINIGVVVTKKVNRGLQMWKRIVKNKPKNDRYRFNNFSYELYNKLELDLKNVNKEKLNNKKLIKPFAFVLDNIDSSEGSTFLPVYLTEAISDYYYQKTPLKRREVFKAVKTIGVNNESVSKLLGGMDQNVNFYNNFIPVFDKKFISPISDDGDAYYNYKVADTQYVAGRRLIHFFFIPKHKGQNTFEGDCWVHDTSFAIQKMNLRLTKEANINYVERLSLIQEYRLLNDSTWFLSKDKFVVDFNLMGKLGLSYIGRKTTTYRDIVINDISVGNELAKNKIQEETLLPKGVMDKADSFWVDVRHEPLTSTEKSIYKMVDTLVAMPQFKRFTNVINFIGTGYYNIGNYQIGPWQNWVSFNSQELLRLRFDLATNRHFSKKVVFHGYTAYGFGDRKWKGEFDAMYLFNRHPRMYVYGSYFNDFDYGQNYYDAISADNIFALAIRKEGVPVKFIKLKEERLDFFKEWNPGISVLVSSRIKQYEPVQNLPEKFYFTSNHGQPLTSFETSVRIRFAYLEKFLENTFYRSSLGSPLPIAEVKYTKGIASLFNSGYDFHKISASISDNVKIAPLGSLYLNVFAGKTYGTLPYMFLDVAPGNEIYYYNRYAFNMMNWYEYVQDRYAGFNIEHIVGNGLFRYFSLTRKLKFRQFWTAKGLWGDISPGNKLLNFVGNYPMRSLNGTTYLEVGTGVDNIFKLLRVDFLWRVLPQENSLNGNYNSSNFGVFGSFRLTF